MAQTIEQQVIIPEHLHGMRLDQALGWIWPAYSRTRIQHWIKLGNITVNGALLRPRDTVQGGEKVILHADLVDTEIWLPEAIPVDVVYEDEAIIVVNKPANLVVHPADSTPNGTLVNGLLTRYPELSLLPRAGIVHRLDKDTTGLLVVARIAEAHNSLVQQLQTRTMGRCYEAIVTGAMTAGGTVDAPINRHPMDRKRMAVVEHGKPAVTHYRVLERFPAHTRIDVRLETGRTHQIRVHMAHIHHPIVGDPVYGGRFRLPPAASPALIQFLQQFKRQALHAKELHLQHPLTGETLSFYAPVPEDMQQLTLLLRTPYATDDPR